MHTTLKMLATLSQIAGYATQDTATLVKLMYGRELVPYIGLVGHNNLGDEVLFEAHKKLFPSFNLVPYRKNGAMIDKMARGFKRSFAQRAILGGGTLINDGDVWLRKAEGLLKNGSRMFCFGTGAETSAFSGQSDATNALLKRWVSTLSKFEFVGVRGPQSKVVLERAGANDVTVIGDTALALTDDDAPKRPPTGNIGLTYGAVEGSPMWGDPRAFRTEVVRVIRRLVNHGYSIKLLPIWDIDIPSNQSLMREIDRPELSMVLAYNSLADFSRELKTCDFFIGQKLHSTIFALMNRVPSIMIEYRPKCRDFMASLDLQHYTIKTSDFTLGAFWPLFGQLRAEAATVRDQAEDRILAYKQLQFAEASKREPVFVAA